MKQPLRNYHTHTTRCRHAEGTDEEYVLAAIETGYDTLGFSDHCPWPVAPGITVGGHMHLDELDDYIQSVRHLQKKYADKIRILLGLECEYLPEYMDWLKKIAEEKQIDYLIFGNHWDKAEGDGTVYPSSQTPEEVKVYVDRAIEAMETGLFCYLAHPDIVLKAYRGPFDEAVQKEMRRLCEAAKRLNMPIEYNLWGVHLYEAEKDSIGLGYPYLPFWKIAAEVGNEVVVGSDAHRVWCLKKPEWVEQAYQTLEGLGMRVLKDYEPTIFWKKGNA